MPRQQPEDELPLERRHEIFRAWADAQEQHDFTPAQARKLIASRFGITEKRVREIEDEGRERMW
jgi:NADH:ubiquinone oxidoreductase subunit E